jgi:Kef-type K+ transport system membrane component KefB
MSALLGRRPFRLTIRSTAEGLLALALLVGALVVVREMQWIAQPGGALYALGFLLIAGSVVGRMVSLVGLPRLTGYLAVGVLSGPHGFALFGKDEVESLTLVNALALALIALQAGAELTLPMLRRSFKSLMAATLTHTVIICVGMMGVFVLLSPYMRFLDGLSLWAIVAVSMVWGAMAVSKAATDALAILAETRSKGPVSEYALGTVILIDVCVLVLFATAMMIARAALDPATTGLSVEGFQALGIELFSSLAAGTTFGLVIALYFRVIGKEKLLFLAVVAYAVTAFCAYFHYDTLLVFVMAGFLVMNLTQQGPALVDTTERAASAVMVVFFATAGAQLDLGALKTAGLIAVALAFARIALTWIASQLGHALARDPPVIRRYGFSAFISQAGVTIGLASIARQQLGEVGAGLSTLLIAVIGINELIGPIAFKLGLVRAGETGRGHMHHEGDGEAAPSPPDLEQTDP